MAKSLIGGLLSSGFQGQNIRAFDTDPEALNTASSLGPISIYDDSHSATNGAHIIVLAVKPQSISQACSSIHASVIKQGLVVVTIAAGITTSFIKEDFSIFRFQPFHHAHSFQRRHLLSSRSEFVENLFRGTF